MAVSVKWQPFLNKLKLTQWSHSNSHHCYNRLVSNYVLMVTNKRRDEAEGKNFDFLLLYSSQHHPSPFACDHQRVIRNWPIRDGIFGISFA